MRLIKFGKLEENPAKLSESLIVKPTLSEFKLTEAKGESKALLPQIEAIHAGATRNHTNYPAERLKGNPELRSGVYSWLYPYPKPVIYNHDTNTAATGRVHSAEFTRQTKAGKEGIILVPRITDPAAIESVQDGRLMTVSIGANTDMAMCNICGTDILAEGFCGHMKGESYDGNMCEWIVGNVYFDELSWVNVPADQNAMVIHTGDLVTGKAAASTEGARTQINESVQGERIIVTENLVHTNEQEGANVMPTIEELQAQVAELTEQLEKVTTEKNELETKLGEATASLETKDAELTEANTKVSELTQTVESLEVERQDAVDKTTELTTELHKQTAERVVDLKVVLGKVSEREEAITQHVARSIESLKDSLVDLLAEAASPKPARQPQAPLVNPAAGAIIDGTEKNVIEAAGGSKPPEKPLDAEGALKGLFSGPAFQKRPLK